MNHEYYSRRLRKAIVNGFAVGFVVGCIMSAFVISLLVINL